MRPSQARAVSADQRAERGPQLAPSERGKERHHVTRRQAPLTRCLLPVDERDPGQRLGNPEGDRHVGDGAELGYLQESGVGAGALGREEASESGEEPDFDRHFAGATRRGSPGRMTSCGSGGLAQWSTAPMLTVDDLRWTTS